MPNSADPSAVRIPTGTLLDSRCATPVKIGTIIGPGAMARPVFNADHPHTVSSHRTAASSPAPKAAENSTAVALDQAKARTRISASSTTGLGWREDRRQKPTSDITDTTNAATTPYDDHPQSGPLTRPSARAPMPTATSRAPSRSGTLVTVRSRESGT